MVIVKRFPDTMSAHIARSILAEDGIEAFVADENLANADPPVVFASGGVRLMVPDEDEERAHRILLEMDAGERHVELPDDFDPGEDTLHQLPPKRPRKAKGFAFGALVLAFVLGAGAMHLYHSKNKHLVLSDGEVPFDSNRDGVDDGTYFYKNSVLIKSTEDSNFDGKIDIEYEYFEGLLEKAKADRDFDGKFETTIHYRDQMNSMVESKLEGTMEVKSFFENGVLSKREWHQLGEVRKIANYDVFGRKLNESLDSDKDGELDTYREFDGFEEITN